VLLRLQWPTSNEEGMTVPMQIKWRGDEEGMALAQGLQTCVGGHCYWCRWRCAPTGRPAETCCHRRSPRRQLGERGSCLLRAPPMPAVPAALDAATRCPKDARRSPPLLCLSPASASPEMRFQFGQLMLASGPPTEVYYR